MKPLRIGLAALLMGLLAVGYFTSQAAAFSGEAPAHALRVDTPALKMGALLALLVVIGLAFVPDREKEPGADPE